MKNTLLIALGLAGLLAAGCAKSHQPDSIVLQGPWAGQEMGASGSPTLSVEGTKLEFHGANTNEWYKATFTLREETVPKQLDAIVTECPAPKYVGKTVHAIYKIEAGTLTLAGNEPGNPAAPASFDAPGARQFVFKK